MRRRRKYCYRRLRNALGVNYRINVKKLEQKEMLLSESDWTQNQDVQK